MRLTVIRSRPFQKTFEKYVRSGRKHVLRTLHEVLHLLMIFDEEAERLLRMHFRDHSLKGNLQGKRELHLSQDDLLIYVIHEKEGIIELLDIVNHEELRKKRS